jgi:CheY-like chemotaxis protein
MSAQTTRSGNAAPGASAAGNLLRMESTLQTFLDRLDDDKDPRTVERRGRRMPYRRNDLRLAVTHPGGGTVERPVLGRDICAKGAGVVYDGFLHAGTDCQLTLRRRAGGHDAVRGRVVHCRHLHGAYHLVDVDFREPIVPKVYVEPADWNRSAAEGEVDPATLVGSVLMLDDQKIDRALAAHCLRGSGVKLNAVASVAEAVAAVRAGGASVNLIMTDLNLEGGERGEQAIVKLREAGYRGPIVVVSAETNPERIAGAWAAGANAVLPKPYTRQQLLASISGLLTTSAGDALPIHSTLLAPSPDGRPPDPASAYLVEEFVSQAHQEVEDLRRAIDTDDLHAARTICQTLKGTGLSFGFPTVTEAAKDAVRALDGTQSIDESLTELRKLESMCLRLRGNAPQGKK